MNKQKENLDSSDLVDEIYDDVELNHSIVSKKDFKPWHHPRKHWLRINQLCRLSQKLIEESHFPDKTFSYLTLPGEELIDIHALKGISGEGSEEILDVQAVEGVFNRGKGKELQLKYIGFNNVGDIKERRATLEYAQSTINDSSRIHNGSKIVNDLVQNISNTNSNSYKIVKEHGPYNLINLDLCTSIANLAPGPSQNTYFDALFKLLEIQRQHMAEPFLLIVATRTELSDINPNALNNILDVYVSNLEDNDFREKLEEILLQKAEEVLVKIQNGKEVSQDTINRIFGVGLGKWLMKIMKPKAPFWDVSLEDIYCYSIGSVSSNMLSIAFKFKRVSEPIHDKYGLAQVNIKEEQLLSEQDLAKQMLERSKSILNVDSILNMDLEQRQKAIKQTSIFLEKSGYSSAEYTEWANSKFNGVQGIA